MIQITDDLKNYILRANKLIKKKELIPGKIKNQSMGDA